MPAPVNTVVIAVVNIDMRIAAMVSPYIATLPTIYVKELVPRQVAVPAKSRVLVPPPK